MFNKEIITKTPEETFELGKKLALYVLKDKKKVMPKIGFRGGLGAGKTVFIKGFVNGLVPDAEVTSPTYTIMNDYSDDKTTIAHVDLYRVNGMDELLGTGFYEALEDTKTIMLMEWFERFPNAADYLLHDIITVDIRNLSDNERAITIKKE